MPETSGNVVGDVKVSGAKQCKDGLEIEQTNEVRTGQNAEGSNHQEAAPPSLGTPVPVIHQKPVGSDRNSEGDGYR